MENSIITFASESEYRAIRDKIDAYQSACNALYGPDKRRFTQAEIEAVGKPYPSNEERSAVETWEFKDYRWESYTVYVDLKRNAVTTWTGQVLGRIKVVGRKWADSMGGQSIPIEVVRINGVVYHGTYFVSSGDYANLKAKRSKGLLVTTESGTGKAN